MSAHLLSLKSLTELFIYITLLPTSSLQRFVFNYLSRLCYVIVNIVFFEKVAVEYKVPKSGPSSKRIVLDFTNYKDLQDYVNAEIERHEHVIIIDVSTA